MAQQLTPLQQQQLLQLSRTMNKLRREEHLTDVVLVCGEQKFPANKVVLVASTPFFAEMFEDNSSDKNCYELSRIPANIMEILVEFMYTGNIQVDLLDTAVLAAVLSAAHDLQLVILAEHCLKNLLQSPSSANIFQLWKMADKIGSAELTSQLMNHLAQNIFNAHNNDYLLELPCDCFIDILTSEDISAESSDDVLRAVITWVCLDVAGRLQDIKLLLPLVDKKGLSDEYLFEIQQMEFFRTCPDLVMFVLEIMTPRFRALSSLRSSSCSLVSVSSESNDVSGKDENGGLTMQGDRSALSSGKSTDGKEVVDAIIKTAALGKDGDGLSTIKEESSILPAKKENPSNFSEHGSAKENNALFDSLGSQKKPDASPTLPSSLKTIPISTSPPVKDTSPASKPSLSSDTNLGNGSEVRKALELTPLLLTPNMQPNRSSVNRNPVPHDSDKPNQLHDGLKPKEAPAKLQRTVANLELLTVGKKLSNNMLQQQNISVQPSRNLSRGLSIERNQRIDSDRNHINNRNRSTDDIFSRFNAAIRSHEANRNHGPNRSFDRSHSFDRNNHDPFHARDLTRNPEPHRMQEPLILRESNRVRDETKYKEPPVVPSPLADTSKQQPVALKNRLPVTVATSQQFESSKDIFFVLQKDNHEWSLESFSTETDEWSSPKAISEKVYQRSTVVSVGHVIYFMGGATDTWNVLKTVLMYNIRTGEWRKLADMQVARWGAGGSQLQAYVYVVGGVSDVNTRLNHVERYNPVLDKWSNIPPLSTCREQPSVTSFDDKLYVIGGYVILPQQWQMRSIETKPTATGEVFNPANNQWTELDTPLSIGRGVSDKTFCTTALKNKLFAIRVRACQMGSTNANPVLFEYSLQAKQWYRHTISDPELMSVAHICSMTDEQLCLVSGKGNVYVFQSTGDATELLKCCDGEKKGLVYAVVPGVSK